MTNPFPTDPTQLALEPLDALDQLRVELDTLEPALSEEHDERGVSEQLAPELPDAEFVPPADDLDRQTMEAMYGTEFPFLNENADEDKWARWPDALWTSTAAGVRARLHLVERNRLFRKGMQWVSSVGHGAWKEPPRPRDAARVVDNRIAPALDQRLQILTEQRPGFRAKPATQDVSDMKRAEAQQLALEYQFDQQNMPAIIRECGYWSGTDGVSFGEVYWDPDAGPWHELGSAEGGVAPGGAGGPGSGRKPIGDVRTRVRRIEQVRVSPNATASRKPWFWVIRDVLPRGEAVREYGSGVSEAQTVSSSADSDVAGLPNIKSGYLIPDADELMREQDLVDRFTVYCEPSEFLPQGLTLIVVGQKVVLKAPLLAGIVPLFRFTDGSSDPAFFPEAVMNVWIDSQMRINAVLSKWVENVRYNAGPRLLSKTNSVVGETIIGGTLSNVEVKGIGNLSELVKELEGFSLASDAKELLGLEVQRFEALSGDNPVSRGSFSAEQSGRAILAIREQLERIFTPPVQAAAEAMTQWAKITLAFMAWGYDIPRTIGVSGSSRPDLARQLGADDFDGATDVFIDPETLMPMPRALRLFLLKEMFQQGLMSPQEYRRRLPFAWVRSIGTPDEDHEARARRVVESIRQTGNPMALPLLWVDNEAIAQDVLERELILPDDTDPIVRQAAIARWTMLAQQAQMKMMAMAPIAPAPGGGSGKPGQSSQPGKSGGLSAAEQPFAGTSPGIAANTYSTIGGQSDERAAGIAFDQRSQR